MPIPDLSPTFPRLDAPGTGRTAWQLTSGDAFCYPLYYFVPSTFDRYLVHHRADAAGVQLWRLDLGTGESVRLTHATGDDTHWRPWCVPAGPGVLDHRSAIDPVRGEVIYFDGAQARAVGIRDGADRPLFELPDGRWPISQNCVTPDGAWFVYVHHDRRLYDEVHPPAGGPSQRHLSRGTELAAFHLETGEHRLLVRADAPFHHVHPLGPDRLAFSSLAAERSILVADLRGGGYRHLRTQDDAGMTCHYCATDAGIAYEVRGDGRDHGGLIDPDSGVRVEFALPADGDTHVGFDPAGALWLYESLGPDRAHRRLRALLRYRGPDDTDWLDLTGDWPVYGGGQKAHHHARVLPGRRHLLITAGDPRTRTNHVFAVDIADLSDHRSVALAGTGSRS